jgi:hypothetical protein
MPAGQALQMLLPILGIHNVGSLFAPVDAILVERAEHSVLLVDGVEKRADMISPGEIDPGEIYGMFVVCHISPRVFARDKGPAVHGLRLVARVFPKLG